MLAIVLPASAVASGKFSVIEERNSSGQFFERLSLSEMIVFSTKKNYKCCTFKSIGIL